MGMYLSMLFEAWASTANEKRILMVGLDNGGKSAILYRLKLAELATTLPTVGFNVETVEYKNVRFTIWDVGGQDKLRALCKTLSIW